MRYPLMCLVGLHGSGKTTIAKHLLSKNTEGDAEWAHLSVGDLARLARRGKAPSGVSTNLLVLLAMTKPGGIIDERTARCLMTYIAKLREHGPVVIDGFPASPEHTLQMDEDCWIAEITVKAVTREQRLLLRAAQTVRQWSPGKPSARDAGVDETLEQARTAGLRVRSFDNDQTSAVVVSNTLLAWMHSVDARTAL